MIHPTAIIDPDARIAEGVTIGPYCIIEGDVQIEDNCTLAAHVILRRGTRLGKSVTVDSFTVIGGAPQSLSTDPQITSCVEVADYTVIREGVTIHKATKEGASTRIGSHCYVMHHAHVGHDSKVGNHCILGAQILLAGHVTLGNYVNMSGNAAVHQFITIGEGAILGGLAAISKNVPPFVMAANRNYSYGINSIGLRRRNYPSQTVRNLKECYQFMHSKSTGTFKNRALEGLEQGVAQCPEAQSFLEFFTQDIHHKGFVLPEESHSSAETKKT